MKLQACRTNDERVITSMTRDRRPDAEIRPTESMGVRLLVLLSSPLWLSAILALVLSRVLQRRRPLLVLHQRVGYRRTALLVPKIATAAVETNARRFGGLVEIAVGLPVELAVNSPIERWMRESGVDELPQLVLVLAGKMRIVGPRPITEAEIATMAAGGDVIGVDVLQPGLVGLWQVLDRHAYELDERRELDLLMIDHWCGGLRRQVIIRAARQASVRLGRRPANW